MPSPLAPALTATPAAFTPDNTPKSLDGVRSSNASVSCSKLTESQAKILAKRAESRKKLNDNQEGGEHSHHDKPGSMVNVIASGVINYLLMFGLCCAYGMIMFGSANAQHRALGVKMNLCTAFIVGLLLAWRCGVPVAVGGPDLNPVVFLGGFISTISTDIAEQHGLVYPESKRRLEMLPFSDLRRLGAGDYDSEWCVGYHYKEYSDACDAYNQELRATAIFATAVSSLGLGLMFFLSGKFHLTRYASYVPTCVMEAFMSCVGYKVFKYALKFCKYDAQQFIPAACVGVPLYFVKAYHIGNPAVVIPLMLFIPLAIFYIAVYGSGNDLDDVGDWMFPKMDNMEFWKIWEDGFGNYKAINIQAWLKTMPELMVMLIVCFIDCLLKLLGTEGKLPVKVDKDREMQLFGLGNVLTTACGSSVGYMQLKFNVINYGILGNVKDRRAGFLYAILCGITFFWTIEHFNFLPRFFLGILLFFAGAGFVAENLWGSRKFLSTREWGQILLILAMFIISGDMLYAVLFGVILTCTDFILTYSKVPCFSENPRKGFETSCARREQMVQNILHHIAEEWSLVVKLKGFVFFASAQTLISKLREVIEAQDQHGVPPFKRLRYIIFDCLHVDGMDASTAKTLRKLATDCKKAKVSILYSNCNTELEHRVLTQELATTREIFPHMDDALSSIEDGVFNYMKEVQKRWQSLHPAFASHRQQELARAMFEPWKGVFSGDRSRIGVPWKYCSGMEVQAASSFLWTPGQRDVPLFMVHTGCIAVFRLPPEENTPAEDWPAPLAYYTRGWFINREALIGLASRGAAIAVENSELVFWTAEEWRQMEKDCPHMASDIQRSVMKQQAQDVLWSEHTEAGRCHQVPEEVANEGSHLRVAQALGEFGIFQGEGDEFNTEEHTSDLLPAIPPAVRDDLVFAFQKYAIPSNGLGHQMEHRSNIELNGDSVVHSASKDTLTHPDLRRGSIVHLTASQPHSSASGGSAGLKLEADKVSEALLFAGAFGPPVNLKDIDFVSLPKFLSIAAELLMVRMQSSQLHHLREGFKACAALGSGEAISRCDLAEALAAALRDAAKSAQDTLLTDKLCNCVVEASYHGMAEEWAGTGDRITMDGFLTWVSRLARLREKSWRLWQGLHEILDKNCGDTQNGMSSERLLSYKHLVAFGTGLNDIQAQEMLWAADWRMAEGGTGESLNIQDALTAITLPAWKIPAKVTAADSLGSERQSLKQVTPAAAEELHAEATATGNSHGIVHQPAPHEPLDSPLPMGQFVPQDQEPHISDEKPEAEPIMSWRGQLHIFFDDPTSSRAASIWWMVMGMLIIVSVMTMFLQPLISEDGNPMSETEKTVWFVIEGFFTSIFTLDFLVRLSVADALGTLTIRRFLCLPSNIADLLSVLPFYVEVALGGDSEHFRLLRVIRLLRLTRISRIAKLAKRHPLFGPVAMVQLVIWFIYLKTNG